MENEDLLVAVKNWIGVEEEIKALQGKLKILKASKKEHTKILANLMNKKNIEGLNLNNDSKLVYKKQKMVGGITKKILITSLSEFIKDADDLDKVIQEVASARQTERGNRADDKVSEAAMEERKKQGYF